MQMKVLIMLLKVYTSVKLVPCSESDTGIIVGWIIFQEQRDPSQYLTAVFNSLMNYEGLSEGLRDLKYQQKAEEDL